MRSIESAAGVAGVHAQLLLLDLSAAVGRVRAGRRADTGVLFQWVWLALAGITVLAAGAGFAYCRANGYDGFTGNVRAMRDANGFEIGIDIGCY